MTTMLQFPTRERVTAPATESAKILKAMLRKTFPATKFSVRLSRGTGYGNCHVTWTDGPTVARVEQVTDLFEGKGFDGMTDSTYYKHKLLLDGRESGIGLLLTGREISINFARRLAAAIARFYGLTTPEISEDKYGHWVVEDRSSNVANTHESWPTLIWRAAHNRASVRG